jgi:hypothetical protein
MQSLTMGITCLAVLCVGWSTNAEDLSKQETAARDFSYRSLSIGTTIEDFLKQVPKAQRMESDESTEWAFYAALTEDNVLLLGAQFFRGRLFMIVPAFDSNELSRIGGTRVMESKVLNTFGIPVSVEHGTIMWRFPKVNRLVTYSYDASKKTATLVVMDTAANEQRIKIQASKSDIGF